MYVSFLFLGIAEYWNKSSLLRPRFWWPMWPDDDGDDNNGNGNSTVNKLNNRMIRSPYEPHQLQAKHYELLHSSSLLSSASSSVLSSNSNVQSSAYDHYHFNYRWSNIVPYFINEPNGHVKFSNLYGHVLPCQIRFKKQELFTTTSSNTGTGASVSSSFGSSTGSPGDTVSGLYHNLNQDELVERIYWEVKDGRSLDGEQYVPVVDVPGLREHRHDGSLAFMPFGYEHSSSSSSTSASWSSISGELHNSLYRCVVVLNDGLGRIISRSIQVSVGKCLFWLYLRPILISSIL